MPMQHLSFTSMDSQPVMQTPNIIAELPRCTGKRSGSWGVQPSLGMAPIFGQTIWVVFPVTPQRRRTLISSWNALNPLPEMHQPPTQQKISSQPHLQRVVFWPSWSMAPTWTFWHFTQSLSGVRALPARGLKTFLIGKKKTAAAKKRLGAKKGLEAQKVSSQSFSKIEQQAQVTEKLCKQ
ncbi:hypothetical protein MC885_004036 [Smutsia gigantea]|nr:hypothetical protein MC885_004036 [Smutsia gigantea]